MQSQGLGELRNGQTLGTRLRPRTCHSCHSSHLEAPEYVKKDRNLQQERFEIEFKASGALVREKRTLWCEKAPVFVVGSNRLTMNAFLKALPAGLLWSHSTYAAVRSVLWCPAHRPSLH